MRTRPTNITLLMVFTLSVLFHCVTCSSRKISEPSSCTINGTVANCSSRHLTEIPTNLLATTTTLLLDGNSIKLLKSNSFRFTPSLTKLSLTKCQLKDLDKDSFRGLKILTSLDISSNNITTLPENVFNEDLKNLKILSLKHNTIGKISQHLFDNLTKLEELHLEHNKLTSIRRHAFTKLSAIKSISIDHNSLTTAYMGWFYPVNATLFHISLGHNPWICDAQMCGYKNWTAIGHRKFNDTIDIFCSAKKTSLKNIHSKDLCVVKQTTHASTTTKAVSLGESTTLICPDLKSKQWTFMTKSKNTSIIKKIEQNEKIKISPGRLVVSKMEKQDSGSYCCNDAIDDNKIRTLTDELQHNILHCQKVKVTSHPQNSPPQGSGGSGASAAIVVILIIVAVALTGFWYMRRKRRNYGLLSDEAVFQPTYDDLQSTTAHFSQNNADSTETTEAYV